jgi:hypothetical protein
MPHRFLSAYDRAHSLLMEAVWEKYASSDQIDAIQRNLLALDAARSEVLTPDLLAA